MMSPVVQIARGARAADPVERAGFGLLISFAVTIPISRAINYAREQRRTVPMLRSLIRQLASGPHDSSPRVHHFLPGTALASQPAAQGSSPTSAGDSG